VKLPGLKKPAPGGAMSHVSHAAEGR
jgi:hypothetical protein